MSTIAVEIERKTFVEVMHAGAFMSEPHVKEVADRTPPKLKNWAYGWRFFDRDVGENYRGPELDASPWHYVGTIKTLDDVKREGPDSILLRNMEGNGWARILMCKQGAIPIPDDAVVIEPEAA